MKAKESSVSKQSVASAVQLNTRRKGLQQELLLDAFHGDNRSIQLPGILEKQDHHNHVDDSGQASCNNLDMVEKTTKRNLKHTIRESNQGGDDSNVNGNDDDDDNDDDDLTPPLL
jgi:hypothetical protein